MRQDKGRGVTILDRKNYIEKRPNMIYLYIGLIL